MTEKVTRGCGRADGGRPSAGGVTWPCQTCSGPGRTDAQGEHALAGRIFLFAVHFTTGILPNMDARFQAEVGLSCPSGGTYQDIARSAVNSPSPLPPDMLILNTAADQLNVASALKAANLVAAS